jgi:CubicO group peptidase (beta-lactamase class C family)
MLAPDRLATTLIPGAGLFTYGLTPAGFMTIIPGGGLLVGALGAQPAAGAPGLPRVGLGGRRTVQAPTIGWGRTSGRRVGFGMFHHGRRARCR